METVIYLGFFLEHAGQMCIIILSRRKGGQEPQYKEGHIQTDPLDKNLGMLTLDKHETTSTPLENSPLAINLVSPGSRGTTEPWLQPWSIAGLPPWLLGWLLLHLAMPMELLGTRALLLERWNITAEPMENSPRPTTGSRLIFSAFFSTQYPSIYRGG
jgi:hypothetical protein